MPPARSRERLVAIVDAATDVFGREGFAAAPMVEIARVAGVSVGTLYNYVEGKEALLLLCAERPFADPLGDRPLPVGAIDRPALVAAVEATLAERVRVPTLERALDAADRTVDGRAELEAIVSELFDLFSSTRRAAWTRWSGAHGTRPTSRSSSTGASAGACSRSSPRTSNGAGTRGHRPPSRPTPRRASSSRP